MPHLRISSFVHFLPLSGGRTLVIDAVRDVRLVVDQEVVNVIKRFAHGYEVGPLAITPLIEGLIHRGILTAHSKAEEHAFVARRFDRFHGRDPLALLERFRRESREGGSLYYAATAALSVKDFEKIGPRIDLVLYGLCDVHIETDFLRQEAASRGINLRVAATTPSDFRFSAEHRHDAILIGALPSRSTIIEESSDPPHAMFLAQARNMIENIRKHSSKPILIDNLPEPTVQPMGFAERGAKGHRNRFRVANLALEELVRDYVDVYTVDLAAAFNQEGAQRFVDDALFGFTHLGSPGWLLQRPEDEKAAVHNTFPDISALAERVGGDPYGREKVAARAHLDGLIAVLGLDRKKCLIVDLDGILWPGVLAETGRPFAWTPEMSPFSYVGVYFGLHEAFKVLKQRGILLACVSKNDEALIKDLWRYEGPHPAGLLTLGDFVTHRINWKDKVENITSIASELGFDLQSFLFVDDSAVERDRVRQRLPEVEVLGDDFFSLRGRLLSDPRLQMVDATQYGVRTDLTKAFLKREAARSAQTEEEFLKSLQLDTRVERLEDTAKAPRVAELLQRTTQFNTTGQKYSVAELNEFIRTRGAAVYVAHVSDRYGDHGLVGAAVVRHGEIVVFALSCRVLGLNVESKLLSHILGDQSEEREQIVGRIIPTGRNNPVRNLYSDHGFLSAGDGIWRRSRSSIEARELYRLN